MATTKAVVDPVKMPKVKANNKLIAGINAASTTLAIFFGWMMIFAGIASFTKDGWSVGVPLVDIFLGTNFGNYGGSASIYLLATGILAVLFAVIGLISARKITDIDAMKSSWKCARNAFAVIAGIEIVKMILIAIYGLAGVGVEKSGVQEGYLWLNGFLSNTLSALGAAAIAFVAHMIAQGKTQVLSIIRFVALGIAGVAIILATISTFVTFYSGCGKTDYKCLQKEYKEKYGL